MKQITGLALCFLLFSQPAFAEEGTLPEASTVSGMQEVEVIFPCEVSLAEQTDVVRSDEKIGKVVRREFTDVQHEVRVIIAIPAGIAALLPAATAALVVSKGTAAGPRQAIELFLPPNDERFLLATDKLRGHCTYEDFWNERNRKSSK